MIKEQPIKTEHIFLVFKKKWDLAEIQPKQQVFRFDSYVPPPSEDIPLDIKLKDGTSAPFAIISQYTEYIQEEDCVRIRFSIGLELEKDTPKKSFWNSAVSIVLEILKSINKSSS